MNDINDSQIIASLKRQITISSAKQVATAGNLANFDTPGYKAKEASFEDALGARLLPATVTNTQHLEGAAIRGVPTREVAGLEERRDGNNVQLDRELLNMSRAAGDFAAAQTALAAKFRLVRYAISESR